MEVGKGMSPDGKPATRSDQSLADAESQITFLRLKLKLLIKDSTEKYDEVKEIIPKSKMHATSSSLE